MSMKRLQGAVRPEIKVLFFDIGNVLVRFDIRGLIAEFSTYLRRHPVRAMHFLTTADVVDSVERGRMSPRAFHKALCAELGFDGDFDRFRRVWCRHFSLEKGTAALLRRVARRRKVYLLSNTNQLHYEFLNRRYAFTWEVDGVVLSYQTKSRKPETAIYRKALRIAGTNARSAFFVDDLAVNVAAAAKIGMVAHLYRGTEDLRLRLKELGVL